MDANRRVQGVRVQQLRSVGQRGVGVSSFKGCCEALKLASTSPRFGNTGDEWAKNVKPPASRSFTSSRARWKAGSIRMTQFLIPATWLAVRRIDANCRVGDLRRAEP